MRVQTSWDENGQSLRLQGYLVKVGGVQVESQGGTGLFCFFNSGMVLITELPQIKTLRVINEI